MYTPEDIVLSELVRILGGVIEKFRAIGWNAPPRAFEPTF